MSNRPLPSPSRDLVNTSVSIVFQMFPELASQKTEVVYEKAASLARSLSCPSCSGSGKMVSRDGSSSIAVAPCPLCSGKGTIHWALEETRAQVLLLDAHATAQKNKMQAAIQQLTTVNQSSTIPEVKQLCLEIAGILAGSIPPSMLSTTDEPTTSS